jgi:hypothetical protein
VEKRTCAVLGLMGVCAGGAIAGPDWTEMGDAGKSTPQVIPFGIQPTTISGMLGTTVARGPGGDADGGLDIADVYDLMIEEPDELIATTFDVSVVFPGSTINAFDMAVWMFRLDRRGLLANNDISTVEQRSRILPIATDGSGARLPGPGRYLLAISFGECQPVAAGQMLFNFGDPPGETQVSGPDGPGGSQPFTTFVPEVTLPRVEYRIFIRPRPCAELCPGDANGDHVVTFADITTVLSRWGNTCPP